MISIAKITSRAKPALTGGAGAQFRFGCSPNAPQNGTPPASAADTGLVAGHQHRETAEVAVRGGRIAQGDLGNWNTVLRDGMPVAFLDWDAAGSSSRWPTSPRQPRPSCHSRRLGSSAKRGSTRCLTYRPACACSWTPMG